MRIYLVNYIIERDGNRTTEELRQHQRELDGILMAHNWNMLGYSNFVRFIKANQHPSEINTALKPYLTDSKDKLLVIEIGNSSASSGFSNEEIQNLKMLVGIDIS